MKYLDVMKEVNALDSIKGWSDDFRFNVEVKVDLLFDESRHMCVSEFVDMCVDLAK